MCDVSFDLTSYFKSVLLAELENSETLVNSFDERSNDTTQCSEMELLGL